MPLPSSSHAGSAVRALTAGLARGDEEAFRSFHDQYFDRLLAYLFVLSRGDADAAHEALQETFIRVARHVRTFDSEEVFWSWLTVVARSAAMDGGRKRSRYWRLLARYAVFWKAASAPDTADESRLELLLAEALAELEPADRELINARYSRRASVRALAAELGLTEKAVESRLTRARRTLRHALSTRMRREANE